MNCSATISVQEQAIRHLPLVRALAKRFTVGDQEELYQQGVIGLMKALRGYNPARGTTFATYAVPLILGEMRQLCRDASMIHFSRREADFRRCIRRAQETLMQQLCREPTIDELAEALHTPADELLLHMDDIIVASTDVDEHAAIIPDPEDWEKRIELRDILSRLPKKDQQLILLRHRNGLSQTQAGEHLGMTQMQVSRREKIIRTMLQRALNE